MLTINDIEKVVTRFGEEVVANPRRVYGILSDWCPRVRIPFDEVVQLCQRWQQGERPPQITIQRNSFSMYGTNYATKEIHITDLGITINKTMKSGINTKTISIHIDTTKSFRH